MSDPELDALYGPLHIALDASDRELKRLRREERGRLTNAEVRTKRLAKQVLLAEAAAKSGLSTACRAFQDGKCKDGEDCPWDHSPEPALPKARLEAKGKAPEVRLSEEIHAANAKPSLEALQLIRKAQSSHALSSMSRNYTRSDPIAIFYAIAIALSHPSYCVDYRLVQSRHWGEDPAREKGQLYTDEDDAALRVFRQIKNGGQQRVRGEIIRVGLARKAAAEMLKEEHTKKNLTKRQRQKAKRDGEKEKKQREEGARVVTSVGGANADHELM
jgi:hypothetical protein